MNRLLGYHLLPTTLGSFEDDIDDGLTSSQFDLEANLDQNDQRAGLKDKEEIIKIMKKQKVTFDEARLIRQQRLLKKNVRPSSIKERKENLGRVKQKVKPKGKEKLEVYIIRVALLVININKYSFYVLDRILILLLVYHSIPNSLPLDLLLLKVVLHNSKKKKDRIFFFSFFHFIQTNIIIFLFIIPSFSFTKQSNSIQFDIIPLHFFYIQYSFSTLPSLSLPPFSYSIIIIIINKTIMYSSSFFFIIIYNK